MARHSHLLAELKRKNMAVTELAKGIQRSRTYLSSMLNGEGYTMNDTLAQQISDFSGIPLDTVKDTDEAKV